MAVALWESGIAFQTKVPFTRFVQRTNSALQPLAAAGMGMGATATKKSKKKKGKKTSSKGMGGKKNGATSAFDVNASLMRLEKKYEEMLQSSTKAMHNDDESGVVSEMVVTVRANPSKSSATADWVPVAQLSLHPHSEVSSEWARAAISLYCRELSQAASLGAKIFATVPRQDIQYAIEPVESWYKHVYDTVVEVANDDSSGKKGEVISSMTKAEAREVLQIDNNNENQASIKQAYRRKSFEWHPDRLDPDLSEDEKENAAHEYGRIQKAYETLSSGIRSEGSSWYASLGGRERTDFRTIDLMGRDAASSLLERYKVQSAVVGLSEELVQTFVSRNQAASTTVGS